LLFSRAPTLAWQQGQIIRQREQRGKHERSDPEIEWKTKSPQRSDVHIIACAFNHVNPFSNYFS
jgi:hypothetical protein